MPDQRDRDKPDGENQPAEKETPTPPAMGPEDLVKAIGSWVISAIIILVVVWVLVFAATRGDVFGYLLLALTGLVILAFVWVRRRFW